MGPKSSDECPFKTQAERELRNTIEERAMGKEFCTLKLRHIRSQEKLKRQHMCTLRPCWDRGPANSLILNF